MAMDPRVLAMMQMQQQQGGGQPMPQPMPPQPMPEPGPTIPDEMSDEDMLDNVQGQMGAPPAIGGMKWQNADEDRAALEANPSNENITAFVDYWGEEELPPSMRGDNAEPDGDEAMGD